MFSCGAAGGRLSFKLFLSFFQEPTLTLFLPFSPFMMSLRESNAAVMEGKHSGEGESVSRISSNILLTVFTPAVDAFFDNVHSSIVAGEGEGANNGLSLSNFGRSIHISLTVIMCPS